MTDAIGRSVRLFLVDGKSTGLITAEIMNWTGHVLSCPRTELPKFLARPEVARTGVYLLHGRDPDDPDRTLADQPSRAKRRSAVRHRGSGAPSLAAAP